jgi:starvation-inducible outer membrane lipoprotein
MILNTHQSIKVVVNAIVIVLIGCISVPAAIAQKTSPSPEATPPKPTPEQPQQNSYVSFGGVIEIFGKLMSAYYLELALTIKSAALNTYLSISRGELCLEFL